jgi:PPOX class probable F420-dependent enzyme
MEYWSAGFLTITPTLHCSNAPYFMPTFRCLTARELAFVRAARSAHLATVDAGGQPHVVPICFAFDGRTLYSAIDEKPKKTAPRELKRVRNISLNPKVAITVDRYDENWQRLAYVLIFGKARLLHKGARHKAAVMLLRRKYRQYRSMALDARPIIGVSAIRAVYWGAF